jgi:hypothetical protein
MSSKNVSPESAAYDLIWGVPGIAEEIGRSTAQTYYLIAQGKIPVAKLGHRTVIASRKQLRRLAGDSEVT